MNSETTYYRPLKDKKNGIRALTSGDPIEFEKEIRELREKK